MTNYLFDRSTQQGRLELADRDRLDLLHRMSTNDMNSLQPGEGRSTVLTTALARIIDRVIVYNRGESVLMIANQPIRVRNWLQRHIFFQDKVKLRDVSSEFGQLELHGPEAGGIADSLAENVSSLALHHFREIPYEVPIEGGAIGGVILAARTFSMIGDGFLFIVPITMLDSFRQQLLSAGNVISGDETQYEQLRIQAGLPGTDHELTETYIPLEANLWDSVSFSKGCYIGQEIIARMESRNRLAKTLVQLYGDKTEDNGTVKSGTELWDTSNGERLVGTITSTAFLDSGKWIGLGFVKPEFAVNGIQLTARVEGADNGVESNNNNTTDNSANSSTDKAGRITVEVRSLEKP